MLSKHFNTFITVFLPLFLPNFKKLLQVISNLVLVLKCENIFENLRVYQKLNIRSEEIRTSGKESSIKFSIAVNF